ncbi:MAG TPA: hypothetical protein VNI81_00090 [Candidatus Limnocylindrales bacterium]|nr:hypothetical protein [Candidatus Limnocylindrales bacterium]
MPRYPEGAELILAFVAAQMVHFCAVIALHTRFAAEQFRLDDPHLAVIMVGFSIVMGAGITASSRTQSKIVRTRHVVLLYRLWLIFAIDYAKHPVKQFRLVAVVVVLALLLRHIPRRRFENDGVILGS